MKSVRTRFAPSPTGYLHVGGIRTALFAYLVARKNHGSLILRFEDTDKKREVAGSREHLITSLRSLGITYDEGPDIGGNYAPYTQSERLDTYKTWAQQLIDAGRAYADPYTPAEIQTFREAAQAAKQPFLYRNHRPQEPPEWDGTMPLRFKSDPKAYAWEDLVMGTLYTGPEVIDDFILIKSDGYPTYNFAHIVDDAEMHITHVMRGQEFVSSMPNYLNLYEALELERPLLAHLPHIMNEQGNKKLGKRDGAKDVLDYIREGYLGEALLSFIATMGWNDGTEQEIYSHDELIARFSLEKVQRSGARFDEKRLLWVNGQFIRHLSLDELFERVNQGAYARTNPDYVPPIAPLKASFWPEEAADHPVAYKKQVLALAQDRLKTLSDLPSLTRYFFAEPERDESLLVNNKVLKNVSLAAQENLIGQAKNALAAIDDWTAESIQDTLNELLVTTQQKPAVLFSLIRIYTTWAPFSPQLNDTLELLGRERALRRLSI